MSLPILLYDTISPICPIDGVSIGRKNNKTTWRIDFKDSATEQQKNDAFRIIDKFDINAYLVRDAEKATADGEAISYVKVDGVIQYLITHTPAECEDYVQANVTDLASAKQFLKKVAMALSVLARSELR